MAVQVPNIVAGSDSELHDEPHVAGSRITVWLLHQRVEREGLDPATVADRYDIALEDVYAALTYYHRNPREMEQVAAARDDALSAAPSAATLLPDDS
jgi:uncharacterized protein (DUF433 family)